ncbi:MAG: IS110 family transposase, partial [Acidobacteria bacterium]|nr:IS110 family transposase [Acidobacteriota bacterium]
IDEAIKKAPPAMRAVVEALQALRGVARITAVTVVAEVGTLSRFARPRPLMGYSGLVSSEYSSGNHVHRGAITKTGNAHLRRVIIESAWAYQYRPWLGGDLLKRQQGLDQDIKEIAWKAQWRLHQRYKKLAAAGKKKPQIVTAVGRELLGFIWTIAVRTEAKFQTERKAA